MEGIELKPCPFCGGEAQIESITKKGETTILCKCSNCGAGTIGVRAYIPDKALAFDVYEECANSVAKRWNQRAGDTP